MSTPALPDLLNVARDAALEAGKLTLKYFREGVAVETKADATPVTIADKEAEKLIRTRIAKAYPDHAVIGEEHGEQKGSAPVRWIVDPIDGTKSFVRGVPLYGVLIGVEVGGKPQVGVLHLPATGDTLCAASGQGCTWNGKPCRVSDVGKLEDATLLTSDTEHCRKRSDAYERLASKAKVVRSWGDAYGYFLVATGRAEVMLDAAMHPWDCAPLLPIVQEAGGHFANWQGEATIWGKDAFATNAKLHKEVLGVLKSEKRRDSGQG